MARITQFNWRRHWSKRVAPHLDNELVQASLDLGMMNLDRNWKRGDPPFLLGAIGGSRIVKGKLSWYQPLNRCHWIAFFSMAIGVLNYPDLDWQFISGDLHTVPVGFGPECKPKVVMDILLFDSKTAEESISHAKIMVDNAPESRGWETCFKLFISKMVPVLRATVRKAEAA